MFLVYSPIEHSVIVSIKMLTAARQEVKIVTKIEL
jgi:hypothetical protein